MIPVRNKKSISTCWLCMYFSSIWTKNKNIFHLTYVPKWKKKILLIMYQKEKNTSSGLWTKKIFFFDYEPKRKNISLWLISLIHSQKEMMSTITFNWIRQKPQKIFLLDYEPTFFFPIMNRKENIFLFDQLVWFITKWSARSHSLERASPHHISLHAENQYSISIPFQPNGNPFGSKLKGKLSPRSHSIEFSPLFWHISPLGAPVGRASYNWI